MLNSKPVGVKRREKWKGKKKEGSPSPVSNFHRRPQPLSLKFELKVIYPPPLSPLVGRESPQPVAAS